jgi:hypothetical protein
MKSEYYSSLQEWHTHQNIAGLGSLIVPVGNDNSGMSVVDGRTVTRMNFIHKADVVMTITVEVSDDKAFTTPLTFVSANSVAGSVFTVYNLPSPEGDLGWLVLPSIFVRVKLEVPGGVASTSNFFHGRAWRE